MDERFELTFAQLITEIYGQKKPKRSVELNVNTIANRLLRNKRKPEENEEGDSVRSKFVTVYDKIGILNESNINLQGRIGYAEYMYGRPKCNYQPWLGWEVTALAEQQTECEI